MNILSYCRHKLSLERQSEVSRPVAETLKNKVIQRQFILLYSKLVILYQMRSWT